MARAARVEEFIRLMSAHEVRLRAYVLSLVPRWVDAEEIIQDVNMVLWKKFHTFTGGNFFAWECKIARFKVKDFRRSRGRDRVTFSDELLETLADEGIEMANQVTDRQVALERCMAKLSDNQKKLIYLRYDRDESVNGIAGKLGRTGEAVYKALTRIRNALHDCISHELRGAS